jgi:allophanate hydrolase subunit 2
VTGSLEVVALAGTALFEDQGRGHRDSGVPSSGAFDRYAHAAGTALVGGGPRDASLEVTGRIDLRVAVPITCAVTGVGTLRVAQRTAPMWTAIEVPARASLSIRTAGRAYLAVAGGFQPPAVLGSRSTCLLGPLGPPPVRVGDHLPIGRAPGLGTAGDFCRPPDRTGPVHVVPGPHLRLNDVTVRVLEQSRIGVRIRPPAALPASDSLPSLGVLPGAIQVLPAGDWMVLGPDAGTMGGYPLVGVVVNADLDRWAQANPGQDVALRAVDARDAPPAAQLQVVRVSSLGG